MHIRLTIAIIAIQRHIITNRHECQYLASFPGFTRALVLRPTRKCTENEMHFLNGLSMSAWVKPGNKASQYQCMLLPFMDSPPYIVWNEAKPVSPHILLQCMHLQLGIVGHPLLALQFELEEYVPTVLWQHCTPTKIL